LISQSPAVIACKWPSALLHKLEAAIMNWLSHWNENAQPFRWTKSAADIKRSIRNAALIYETQH
jgi:hypothetical protein